MEYGLQFYILGPGNTALPVDDITTWSEWMAKNRPDGILRVAFDNILGVEISTVFLGLDHRIWPPGAPPLIFETMILNDYNTGGPWRYSTWDEALRGHTEIVAEITARLKPQTEGLSS